MLPFVFFISSISQKCVTHTLRQARRIADYVIFIYLGEVIEAGPATEFFGNTKEFFPINALSNFSLRQRKTGFFSIKRVTFIRNSTKKNSANTKFFTRPY